MVRIRFDNSPLLCSNCLSINLSIYLTMSCLVGGRGRGMEVGACRQAVEQAFRLLNLEKPQAPTVCSCGGRSNHEAPSKHGQQHCIARFRLKMGRLRSRKEGRNSSAAARSHVLKLASCETSMLWRCILFRAGPESESGRVQFIHSFAMSLVRSFIPQRRPVAAVALVTVRWRGFHVR